MYQLGLASPALRLPYIHEQLLHTGTIWRIRCPEMPDLGHLWILIEYSHPS